MKFLKWVLKHNMYDKKNISISSNRLRKAIIYENIWKGKVSYFKYSRYQYLSKAAFLSHQAVLFIFKKEYSKIFLNFRKHIKLFYSYLGICFFWWEAQQNFIFSDAGKRRKIWSCMSILEFRIIHNIKTFPYSEDLQSYSLTDFLLRGI